MWLTTKLTCYFGNQLKIFLYNDGKGVLQKLVKYPSKKMCLYIRVCHRGEW